jgi:hypothetical protein
MSSIVVVFGEMIAVNAAFSFASDVTAQLLEGKRFSTCCTDVPAAPAAASGAPLDEDKKKVVAEGEFAEEGKHTDASAPSEEGEVLGEKSDAVPAVVFIPVAPSSAAAPPGPASSPAAFQQVQMCEVPPPFEWNRAAKFASTGVIFCGVVQFVRLEVIENLFPKGAAGGTVLTALEKTAFNQLVFSPVVRALSMATIQYMETQSCEDVKAKLKNDFLEAQGVSYAVKPVSNILAFVLFPHNMIGQTVVMRSVAFAYNVYFSYVAHRKVENGSDPHPHKHKHTHGGKEPPTGVEGGGSAKQKELGDEDPTQRLLGEQAADEERKRKADARKCKMCRSCSTCSVM